CTASGSPIFPRAMTAIFTDRSLNGALRRGCGGSARTRPGPPPPGPTRTSTGASRRARPGPPVAFFGRQDSSGVNRSSGGDVGDQRDVWLVVPVYNEAPVIADVVREARKTFPNVVCVDDGSKDRSAEQIRPAGAT